MNKVRYIYGMRHRPFSIGCQPMNGLVERRDSDRRGFWDILVYSRKLEDWELRNFELDYIGEEIVS